MSKRYVVKIGKLRFHGTAPRDPAGFAQLVQAEVAARLAPESRTATVGGPDRPLANRVAASVARVVGRVGGE